VKLEWLTGSAVLSVAFSLHGNLTTFSEPDKSGYIPVHSTNHRQALGHLMCSDIGPLDG
jgi:hypothetical protein